MTAVERVTLGRLRGMLKGYIEEWERERAWAIQREAHAWVGLAQGSMEAYRTVLELLDQMEGKEKEASP